jgi:hypothetical protein
MNFKSTDVAPLSLIIWRICFGVIERVALLAASGTATPYFRLSQRPTAFHVRGNDRKILRGRASDALAIPARRHPTLCVTKIHLTQRP